MRYRIEWDNGHSCGLLSEVFTSERAAIAAAREWKREMVAIETTAKGRREARLAYQWEVVAEEEK